jgi:hypothetical protein
MTRSFGCQRSYDKPPGGTPPVPGLGQRAINARRRHLKGVRLVAHLGRAVELDRHLTAGKRNIVQADAAISVDEYPQEPPPAGRGYPHAFQVHVHRVDHGLQQARQPV